MSDLEIMRAICGYAQSEGGFNISHFRTVLRKNYQVDEDQLENLDRKGLQFLLMRYFFASDIKQKNVILSDTTEKKADKATVIFSGPKQKFGELSMVAYSGFKYENIDVVSAENAYQAAKYLGPEATKIDKKYATFILTTESGFRARYLGEKKPYNAFSTKWNHSKTNKTKISELVEEYKDIVNVRKDWDQVKSQILFDILKLKFADSTLKKVLKDTGDVVLKEVVSADNGPRTDVDVDLGSILMRVRDSI